MRIIYYLIEFLRNYLLHIIIGTIGFCIGIYLRGTTIENCVHDKIEVDIGPNDTVSNIDVLTETIKFMLKNVDEDDEHLIKFVRHKLIKAPSHIPLSLENMKLTDFSQYGQSKIIDDKLKGRRNGFFIEAGGWDGEQYSNTLFFELNRNWTGILIEPIPEYYNKILSKNRNIFTINACISGKKPFIAKFVVANALSGRLDEMSDYHRNTFKHVYDKGPKKFAYVPCIPLNTILKAINVPHVDYFSLDVEGAEWDIIRDLKIDKLSIDTLSIEWASNPDQKKLIKERLSQFGYETFKNGFMDIFLAKAGL